jgi:hypothetical protein
MRCEKVFQFCVYMKTWTSCANSCLSVNGLWPLPGYEKARSRPSKFFARRYVIDVLMNCWRFATDDSMVDIADVPAVVPPTASRVLRPRLVDFRLLMRRYLKIVQANYAPTADPNLWDTEVRASSEFGTLRQAMEGASSEFFVNNSWLDSSSSDYQSVRKLPDSVVFLCGTSRCGNNG